MRTHQTPSRHTVPTYLLLMALGFTAVISGAALTEEPAPRHFPAGSLQRLEELPPGRFRAQLDGLSPQGRARALEWLQSIDLPAADTASLHADPHGGICYACEFGHGAPSPAPPVEPSTPEISVAAVPVSPFPDSLKFNSRPGATRRIYVNFVGQSVSGTAWNTSLGRDPIVALPFSTDSDTTTFSDSEQLAIKRIWLRMAEDFAPFDVNVTTERPATISSTTAIVLITRNTDASGAPNPSSTAGGVAYVNVFGGSNFISTYSPAWVYHNNLGNSESNIAEAASHEIGHNLGLTHDGTSTQAYYGGHGSSSDPISWGPLMGTGYGKNVTQWSKGEYLNANNTQDDLAIIAGKLGYRTDDHGNTPGTARPLTLTDRTQILSTTPENDPTNANPANKGILERNTDIDVFSFVTGSGTVQLNVNPWTQPAGTRGGNLDVLLQLYDEAGTLIAASNPASLTTAAITATVPQGIYYLHVRNTGTGDPLAATPTGYTVYGSHGQYFISGTLVDASGVIVPPVAEAELSPLNTPGLANHTFTITYTDNAAIDVATVGTGDVRVTGPNGYNQLATLVSISSSTNGSPRTATYSVTPPSASTWSALHNGTYAVAMEPNQVRDIESEPVPAGPLGEFEVSIPVPLYSANMSSNPGWTLDSNWSYAQPNYSSGPKSGFTGSNVIGHSMSGNYPKALPIAYATTPLITNAGGSSSLTLRFRRWLGLRRDDTAILQVSGDDGASWTTLWSTTATVGDSSWQLMQYPLPQAIIGSTQIRFRWGLGSIPRAGNSPTAIGWHLDDVELLGGGALDASPPAAILSVADLTQAGAPTHSCTVTYTDATAVLRTSIDPTDLLIIGPAGPLAPLAIESVGVDLPSNGTPINATYSIAAPGGTWDAADNGTYSITLKQDAIEDTLGNTLPEMLLGTFTVNLTPPLQPATITLGDLFQTYDGSPKSITVTTDPSSLTLAITYDEAAEPPTDAGTYAVRATVTQPGYEGVAAGELIIAKAQQSITFAPIPPVPAGQPPFDLTATASSTLPVTFISSNPDVATISENTVTLVAPGETLITATQPGNENWLPAPAISQVLTVLTPYQSWASGTFTHPLADPSPTADPDADGLENLLEFAFGTDPSAPNLAPLAWTDGLLTRPGSPTILAENGTFHAVFARRRDHLSAGLTYAIQFSADLTAPWTTTDATPEIIATDGQIDAVKVPFPTPPPNTPPPRFFRLNLSLQAP